MIFVKESNNFYYIVYNFYNINNICARIKQNYSYKELAISGIRRENILSFINDEFRLINAFSMPITRLLRYGTFISFENKKVYTYINNIL